MKTTVLFLAISGPKFMKFWDNAGDHSWFPMPFPDYLCHISCRRYWPSNLPLSCEMLKIGSFGPQKSLHSVI